MGSNLSFRFLFPLPEKSYVEQNLPNGTERRKWISGKRSVEFDPGGCFIKSFPFFQFLIGFQNDV